jgi:glycosyltransferase involved in cell wall biosynthesis
VKISVILASYLGNYQGAASNREEKLERAIRSFQMQNYLNKELIVVSDGCEKTNNLIQSKYNHPDIKLVSIPKQDTFSGEVRSAGIKNASGDYICYLDLDDYFGNNMHLYNIMLNFFDKDMDWVYFDDIVLWNIAVSSPRVVTLDSGSVGTSNIAHKNFNDIDWKGMNGYGHDYYFIMRLKEKYSNFEKIHGCSYTVCHIPNVVDI